MTTPPGRPDQPGRAYVLGEMYEDGQVLPEGWSPPLNAGEPPIEARPAAPVAVLLPGETRGGVTRGKKPGHGARGHD